MPSASHPTPLWSVAGFIALAAFGSSMIAQLLVLLLSGSVGAHAAAKETPIALARGALIVQSALAILIGVVLLKVPALRKRALVFHRVSPGALLIGLFLVLGIAPAANELGYYLSRVMREPIDSALWVTRIVQHANIAELLLLGFALTLVPACIEELLFRGLLMGALRGAPRPVVLVLPALLFGIFHMDWAQGAATFVLGLGFGFLRMSTCSLFTPIAAHATYNLVVLLTMRWMKDADSPAPQSLGVLCVGLGIAALCTLALERNHRFRAAQSEDC